MVRNPSVIVNSLVKTGYTMVEYCCSWLTWEILFLLAVSSTLTLSHHATPHHTTPPLTSFAGPMQTIIVAKTQNYPISFHPIVFSVNKD